MELLGDHPRELCGLVTPDWDIIPIPNAATNGLSEFAMDFPAVAHALTTRDIMGMYHTHPGGTREPSYQDRMNYVRDSLWFRYFIAVPGELIEWRIDAAEGLAHEVHHVPAQAGP